MTAPRSHLASLLRTRRHAELRLAIVVAEAERNRIETEQAITSSDQRIESARQSLRGALEGPLNAALLRLTAQGALTEERQRHRTVQRLAAMAPAIERARGALADASAQRKAVELLRERRRLEESQRAARVEQAALDEIAARAEGGFA